MEPPGGETALDQSESAPHLSDNRGLYGGAPSGKKRTTNQNAPFQISTNQNEANCPSNLRIQKLLHTTGYPSIAVCGCPDALSGHIGCHGVHVYSVNLLSVQLVGLVSDVRQVRFA